MPEPVCKSHLSRGYKLEFAMLAFNWVFRTKYCRGRSQVRGKPSALASHRQKVKRSEMWNCTHLRFRSVYLGLEKRRQRSVGSSQSEAEQAMVATLFQGRLEVVVVESPARGQHSTNVKLCKWAVAGGYDERGKWGDIMDVWRSEGGVNELSTHFTFILLHRFGETWRL